MPASPNAPSSMEVGSGTVVPGVAWIKSWLLPLSQVVSL
jgi:hypothetical protein